MDLFWFADDRIRNEGGHALLWETLHPVWTDDHRESCLFHTLSARPGRQHQGVSMFIKKKKKEVFVVRKLNHLNQQSSQKHV